MDEEEQQDCGMIDVGCHIGNLVGDFFDMLARRFIEAVGDVVESIATWWIAVPTPQLATDASGTPSDPVAFLQSHLGFYTAVLATLSICVGIARIAWAARSGGHSREVGNLARAVITFVLVNTLGLAAVWVGVQAGDEFSVWILERATGGTDFAENLTGILGMTAALPLGALLLVFLAFLNMIFGLMQLVAMIARGGALVILAGVWPTAAAFRTSEYGEQWYRRITAWMIGLVLYKPACAIIYAAAFRLVGQDAFAPDGESALVDVLTGMFMMILAVFALPALAKFAVPLVAAAHMRGGGGGGAEAVGAVATGAALVGGYVHSNKTQGATPGAPAAGGSTPGGGQPPGGARSFGPGPGGTPPPAGGAAAGGAAAAHPAAAAVTAGTQLVGAAGSAANRTVNTTAGGDEK